MACNAGIGIVSITDWLKGMDWVCRHVETSVLCSDMDQEFIDRSLRSRSAKQTLFYCGFCPRELLAFKTLGQY